MGSPSIPAAPPPPPAPPSTTGADISIANKEAMEYYATTGYPLILEALRQGKMSSLGTDLDIYRKTSDASVENQLTLGRRYGGDAANLSRTLMRRSDPQRFESAERYGDSINADLAQGSKASPSEARAAEQDIRSAQASRGNLYGNAPTATEVLAKFNVGQQLRQQRLANAQSYLGLAPIAGQIPSATPSGQAFQPSIPLPMANSPFMGGQQMLQGAGINAQNYGSQLNYLSSTYGAQTAANAATYQNPLAAGIGAAQGIAGIGMGIGGLLCWLAREVYGESDNNWVYFREWMLSFAPEWLFKLYCKHGMWLAKFVSGKPMLKGIIRKFMDTKVGEMKLRLAPYGFTPQQA